jgi:hypothetical protein
MRNRSGVRSFNSDICVDLNDEANDNLDDQVQLNSSRTRTAFELARRNPRQTTNKPLRMLQDLPELATSNNIILYCLSQLFPMMLTNPFSSATIRGGSCLCKTLQSKYQPSFQQADNSCYTTWKAAAMEIAWSNNSFWNSTKHAKQKIMEDDRISRNTH